MSHKYNDWNLIEGKEEVKTEWWEIVGLILAIPAAYILILILLTLGGK